MLRDARETSVLLPAVAVVPKLNPPNKFAASLCAMHCVMQVIPSNRLFYGSDPVGDSPYTVTVLPHKPSQPQEVALAVEAWDQVKVSFMPPENDGGEAVDGYMVEWWAATSTGGYGDPEIQTIKISGDVDGEAIKLSNQQQ